MLASLFTDEAYLEGLKALHEAIEFFRCHPLINRSKDKGLPETIAEVSIEIVDLSLEELRHLWARHARSYHPSVLFRVRLTTQAPDEANRPVITGIGSTKQDL